MKTILHILFLFIFSNFTQAQHFNTIVYEGKEYFKLPDTFDVGKAMFPGIYGRGYFDQFTLQDGDWILMNSYEPVNHLPALIGQIINSRPEGIWKTYSVNWDNTSSYVSAEFEFRNGVIEGFYRGYKKDGTLRSEYEMKNDVYHGQSTHFNNNGDVSVSGRFEYGLKVGLWRSYDQNGEISSIESYVENIPEEMKEVYSNPLKFKEKFYNDANYIIEEVLNPGYHGTRAYYYNGNVTTEKIYDNGLLVYYREFHPNGVVKVEGPCRGEYPPKDPKKVYKPDEKYESFVKTGKWIYRDETGSVVEVVER